LGLIGLRVATDGTLVVVGEIMFVILCVCVCVFHALLMSALFTYAHAMIFHVVDIMMYRLVETNGEFVACKKILWMCVGNDAMLITKSFANPRVNVVKDVSWILRNCACGSLMV
jgi:hypothetical protein